MPESPDLVWSSQAVSREIHSADEMYRYSRGLVHGDERAARHLYFEKGRQIAEAVEQVATAGFGSLGETPSLLDFASGFGRGTRFVVSGLDAKRVTICEIQEEAAEFLRSALGVDCLPAFARPEDASWSRRFSMITVASFFTHCPPGLFAGWLEELRGLLRPSGALMFSVLDIGDAPGEAAAFGTHFAFSPTSESEVLDPEEYGTTWVSEELVRDLLAPETRAGALLERIPRGLCAHQDLWVLRRGSAAERDLRLERHPAGHAEAVTRQGDEVLVSGWVEDLDRPGAIEKVQVEIEGAFTTQAAVAPAGPDGRQDWSGRLSLDSVGLDDLIVVDAIAGSGRRSLLGVGSLRPVLDA